MDGFYYRGNKEFEKRTNGELRKRTGEVKKKWNKYIGVNRQEEGKIIVRQELEVDIPKLQIPRGHNREY